jgi:hypothetical protein
MNTIEFTRNQERGVFPERQDVATPVWRNGAVPADVADQKASGQRGQHAGEEQAVPDAPCRERAAVHLEAMVHGRRREAGEAKDPTLV